MEKKISEKDKNETTCNKVLDPLTLTLAEKLSKQSLQDDGIISVKANLTMFKK